MSPTELPSAGELLERYKAACDLKQTPDVERIADRILAWGATVTDVKLRFVRVTDAAGVRDAARAARDAWAARDARAAWDVAWASVAAVGFADRSDLDGLRRWLPMFEAFEAGAFALWITADELRVAVIPKTLKLDARRRLHSAAGPAFAWLEDIADHYWHGVNVPAHVIDRPEEITVSQIEAEKNAEVRRVMLDRFGAERFLREIGATEVHRDECGTLHRVELGGDEPIVMVEVVNSTPEPDGSWKKYMLRVPPGVKTAREAVAWTFGKTAADYTPQIQT